jgi:glycerol-3-phosphate acyltransferase PlsY
MIMNELINTLYAEPWLLVLICSISGYLIGSISFARLINFWVTKEKKVKSWMVSVPHSDEVFESDLVSATLMAKTLGPKYGCLTSLADMVKVALPTLLVKLVYPEDPYFLAVALFGIVGHNYPVYHGFKGGRGESPLIGGLLIIDWFGIIITNAAATILGFTVGKVLVMRWGAMVLMIFWYWYHFNSQYYVGYMIGANFLYWFSMRKDLARYNELKTRKGLQFTEEDVSEFIGMGRSMGRMLDKYSLAALLKRAIRSEKPGNQ